MIKARIKGKVIKEQRNLKKRPSNGMTIWRLMIVKIKREIYHHHLGKIGIHYILRT
jgi:hypothetical protein